LHVLRIGGGIDKVCEEELEDGVEGRSRRRGDEEEDFSRARMSRQHIGKSKTGVGRRRRTIPG